MSCRCINVPLNFLSLPNLADITHLNNHWSNIGNVLPNAASVFVEDKARSILKQKNTKGLYT